MAFLTITSLFGNVHTFYITKKSHWSYWQMESEKLCASVKIFYQVNIWIRGCIKLHRRNIWVIYVMHNVCECILRHWIELGFLLYSISFYHIFVFNEVYVKFRFTRVLYWDVRRNFCLGHSCHTNFSHIQSFIVRNV